MRTFDVATPDGRRIRHRSTSLEKLKGSLIDGYEVIGEFVETMEDGSAGYLVPLMPDGRPHYNLLSYLLEHHGDELLAWLRAHGVQQVRGVKA